MLKKLAWILAVVVPAGGLTLWIALRQAPSVPPYRLGSVERGELRVTVSSTGTVQPFVLVQVGTQVTGAIQKLFVDFNSKVTAGQVVAQIDPAIYRARVDQDRANVARAEADVDRVKANLVQAEKDLERMRDLVRENVSPESQLDAALAQRDSLAAQVKVAEATVVQSRAALDSSQVNLRYTTIVSPIDGVVISRNVDVGQTVAASLQAPTIYVIADDMRRVQVQASVAEADIGRVAAGQAVSFSVDAHRDRRFAGRVSQIRLSPTTLQNVVTYTVMIDAENPGGLLLPGMTANLVFDIARYPDVLKVPNAALRFVPAGVARSSECRRVWVPGPNGPLEVPVMPGESDGSFTAIQSDALRPGDSVIVGRQEEGTSSLSNPFTPRFPGGGRR